MAARISMGKAWGLSGHVALPVVWNLGCAKQRKEDERPRPRTGAVRVWNSLSRRSLPVGAPSEGDLIPAFSLLFLPVNQMSRSLSPRQNINSHILGEICRRKSFP